MREQDEDWPENDEDWTDEQSLALIEGVFAFLKSNGVNIPYTVDNRGEIHCDEEAFEAGMLWLGKYADERRRQEMMSHRRKRER